MKVTTLEITVTMIEPVLGLASANPEIQREFIAAKAKDAAKEKEEVEAIPVPAEEQIEKATTIFPKDETGLFWWDYQMRGSFKGWLETLAELGDTKVSKWGAKKAVDKFLFVRPRRIYIRDGAGQIYQAATETMQRPLRAETMQGDRIALASSEMLPVGTNWTFMVTLLTGTNTKSKLAILTEDDVQRCLDLGGFSGFGQWRGGGWGRFSYLMKRVGDDEKTEK